MMRTSTHFLGHFLGFQETVRPSQSKQKRSFFSQLKSHLDHLGQALIDINSDPQISKLCDRFGTPYWKVYDPITDQRYYFDEENDVYRWIEQRYNLQSES